jgi:hypothetical protein
MPWTVVFHDDFEPEFEELPVEVQNELLARTRLLQQFGPDLGRPNVDTLDGSSFSNMKELRFRLEGLWRFAFAFDPHRQAIVWSEATSWERIKLASIAISSAQRMRGLRRTLLV